MNRPRRKPYTAIGISRVPCSRCGAPSTSQWQICADGNQYRGLCTDCDIKINRLVLLFMRIPDRDDKMMKYTARRRNK